MELAHHRRVERVVELGEPCVRPVHREGVLDQVVGSHREEVAVPGQLGGVQGRGGGLDHDPQLVPLVVGDPVVLELVLLRLQELPDLPHLLHVVHHGDHDPHIPVGGGAKEGPELGPEELGLVQADPDGPPPQERVLLPGHVKEHGELVPAQIEGADIHRPAGEGLCHLPVRVVLLLAGRHAVAPHHEELGAEEADAVGAVGMGMGRLCREVQVGTKGDGLPVQRHRLLSGDDGDLLLPVLEALAPGLERGVVRRRRVQDDAADAPVQDRLLPLLGQGRHAPQPHHRRDLQGPGQDDPVGGARAQVGGDAKDPCRVQVDRKARREVPRHHHDPVLLPGQVRRVVVAQKVVKDADHHVLQVVEAVQHHGLGRPTPHGLELQHPPLEGALRLQVVLLDVAHSTRNHRRVVQDEELGIEDPGLHRTQASLRDRLDLPDPFLRPLTGLVEALHLVGHLLRGNRLVGDVGDPPLEEEDLPGGNPLRGR